MNTPRFILVARMFARMLGRVPARHLWYLWRRMRFEKPHPFAGQVRINTFFPPYPSSAFDRFCDAVIARRRVPYSTYVAVTGACPYRCGHCSYAGRSGTESTTAELKELIAQIKGLGTCTLGLTGGEPLLRGDLEELIAAAGPEMATVLFTTGHGLDHVRARSLADARVTCVTVGIEHSDAAQHDAVRGVGGSFEEGEAAFHACRAAGIYTAISTVATREKIVAGELATMYELGRRWGVGEFRILAPVATGAWTGCASTMLSVAERDALKRFHRQHNHHRNGPAVACFAYLESNELFGCGAGFHHLFIDAAGNVCPCDLTPLSFGNTTAEPLADIWRRMATYFPIPRRGCLMNTIGPQFAPGTALPVCREDSEQLCGACPPRTPLPEGYRRLITSPDDVTHP